jgi:GPH family glycoside/pentoside/hexuronide:cation symporter
MVLSMGAFSVVMLLMVTVGMFGDERTALCQMAVLCVLAGPGVAGLFALPYALLASITDADERACGERREAMFFGVQGMVLKAGWGLAPLVGGLLMDNLGGTATHPLGLHLTGPVAAAFALVGLLVLRTFPEPPDREEHVAV